MGKAKRPPPRNRPKARPATSGERPGAASRRTPPAAARPAHEGENRRKTEAAGTAKGAAGANVSPTATPAAAAGTAPRPVLVACAILGAEALALVGLGLFLLYRTVFGHPDSVPTALLDAAAAIGGAVALGFGARGLLRLRPAARTPVIVIQVLSIPVSYTIAFQADRVALGGPIFVAALAVIYLLFTPPARAALDREPPA